MGIFPKLLKRSSKESYVPGERWRLKRRERAERVPRYQVEALEPRHLLSATPLYDPADGTGTGANPGDSEVATQIEAKIEDLFSRLGKYGESIRESPEAAEIPLPFFQQSLNDLLGTDIDAGTFLIGGTGDDSWLKTAQNYFDSEAAGDGTPRTDELVEELNLAAQTVFGTNVFTDTSTSDLMSLDFSFDLAKMTDLSLKLGNEALEFGMSLEDDAHVDLDFDPITFSIQADLSQFDITSANQNSTQDKSEVASNYWVAFGADSDADGIPNGEGLRITASSTHTTSGTSPNALEDFGVGFGLVEARANATSAGGHVDFGTGPEDGDGGEFDYALDITFDVSDIGTDGKWTLAEMSSTKADMANEYNAVTPDAVNNARLYLPVAIADPHGDISGLDQVSGAFTFNDSNLFDGLAPLVQASDQTITSFSRLNVDDMLQYFRNVQNLVGQTDNLEEMQELIPFLGLSLGQAYGFDDAVGSELLDAITLKENVLLARNAPANDGDPLDFSGTSKFTIFVSVAGANTTSKVVTVSGATSFANLITKLNDELPTGVTARSSGGASPRLEFKAAENTTFFINNINPNSTTQKLDLGIDPFGLVFARNTGAITPATGATSNPDLTYQLDGVSLSSDAGFTVYNMTSPLHIKVQVDDETARDVRIPVGEFAAVGGFVSAVQTALADAGLFNLSAGTGVKAERITVGDGFGIKISHTDATKTLTLSEGASGGTDLGFFNLTADTEASSHSSSSRIQLSPFDAAPVTLTVTASTQTANDGLTTASEEIVIPADVYANHEELRDAIRESLINAGMLDRLTDVGVGVQLEYFSNGTVGVEFFGSAEVYELTISGTQSELAKFGFTSNTTTNTYTSTAPFINISVAKDGSAATTHKIYVNGNTTREYYGQEANSSVGELVEDIRGALSRADVLDLIRGTGVDIRVIPDEQGDNTNTIEFFARNPGPGTGYIQAISTGSQSGLGRLNFASDNSNGKSFAISELDQSPKFSGIQSLVTLLNDNSLLESTAQFAAGDLTADPAQSPHFRLPIRLQVSDMPDLENIELNFLNAYGETNSGRITNLDSDGTVSVSRTQDLRFTMEVDLVQPPAAAESLRVELPVIIPDWNGQLEDDAAFDVVLEDGVERRILVTASEASSNSDIDDFITILNTKIAAISIGGSATLNSKLTASADKESYDRPVIRFETVAGTSKSLVVRVPEFVNDPASARLTDEASDKLGFTVNVSEGNEREEYLFAGADNADIGILTGAEPFTSSTGYVLDQDMFLRFTLPDNTVKMARITATSTDGNTNLNNLVADINSVLDGDSTLPVKAKNVGGALKFDFTGSTSTSDPKTWQVDLAKRIYLGSGTDPIVGDDAIEITGLNTGFELDNEAFFTFTLPDGTASRVQVSVSQTDGSDGTTANVSRQDLVDDINDAILSTPGMGDGFNAKVVATLNSSNQIEFALNTEYFPQGGNWNLQVGTEYRNQLPNAAHHELRMPDEVSTESSIAQIGPISAQLETSSDFQLSNDLQVDISVNGSDYVTVTVDSDDTDGTTSSTTENTSLGDLIADINAVLADTDVDVPNASGTTTSYKLSNFVEAVAIASAKRIQLQIKDDAAIDVRNVRFTPTNTSNNGYEEVGFFDSASRQVTRGLPDLEDRIGIRGSDVRLSNIQLAGTATVTDADVAGSGNFGYVDFNFGETDLDVTMASTLTISGTEDRMQDQMRALGSYRGEYTSAQFDTNLGIGDSTEARILLDDLSFPADNVTGISIPGLEFNNTGNPTIEIHYTETGGTADTKIPNEEGVLSNLPAPEMVFTDTQNNELLSRISFNDVINSLWRVGDFLSDWLNNGSFTDDSGNTIDSPFGSTLFFTKSKLIEEYDFGLAFNKVVDSIAANPPSSLQEIQRALASGLLLEPADISLNLVSSGTSASPTKVLNIAFDLVRTFAKTLPLHIDLAAFYNRYPEQAFAKQSLLDLNSLSGNPADPMEVELSLLSKLQLNLDLVLVEDGQVIEPKPVLKQPASGHFFETKFHLNGDSYDGDIPAGANRLRLGFSWINDLNQEVLAPGDIEPAANAVAATTGNLSGSYNAANGTLTASSNGSLSIDGVALSKRDGNNPGDIVLLKDQTNSTENGLYEVIEVGNSSTAWVLQRLQERMEALAVNTAATYNATSKLLTASNRGKLAVDDVEEGALIAVTGQTDTTQNGIYQVIDIGTNDSSDTAADGSPWVLKRHADLTDGAGSQNWRAYDLDWRKVNVGGGLKNTDRTFMIKDIPVVDVVGAVSSNVTGTYTDDDPNDTFLPILEGTGNFTVDGTTPDRGDFVFLRGQTDISQNGVYQVWVNGSGTFELIHMGIGMTTTGAARVTAGANANKTFLITQGTVSELTGDEPVSVVELRPAAVAINETAEVALPDANGTPSVYHEEAVLTDPDDIPDPDVTVEVSTTNTLPANFNGSVEAGTLTAINNGTISIDGQTLFANDLVLVNHQLDASQNGIYKVTNVGGDSTKWELTRDDSYDENTELTGVKVAVTNGTYGGREFIQIESPAVLNSSTVRFAKLIDPASYQLDLREHDSTTSKQLPYWVTAATTGQFIDVNGDAFDGTNYNNGDSTTPASITASDNQNLNRIALKAWDPVLETEITVRGIDGFQNLRVGDRILVKDYGRADTDPTSSYSGDYRNGIYEVVDLGQSGTTAEGGRPWKLERVDFADSGAELKLIRVAVNRGIYNSDTRFIQAKNTPEISAGVDSLYDSSIANVYGNFDGVSLDSSWMDFSAVGQLIASLPLSVVVATDDGAETVFTKDLGSLTDDEKKALGLLGSDIVNDDLYKSMADLETLRIQILNDNDSVKDGPYDDTYTGSGLDKFFATQLFAVEFDPLTRLDRALPPTDVLALLRDWALVGDALDLALFNLQFAMDRALGIEIPLLGGRLPRYVSFIEDFRDNLTTNVRENVRLNPLRPIKALRDAMFTALGPDGVGYVATADAIDIDIVGQESWIITEDVDTNPDFIGITDDGQLFEKVSGTAAEFSVQISRALDTMADAITIDQIDIGDTAFGLDISNQTESLNSSGAVSNTTGGVNLRRSFDFNFGFGMSVLDGFYIFNPTQPVGSTAATKDMIKVGIEAELDGDIHTDGIQQFMQSDYVSQLNQISVALIDGRWDYSTDGVGTDDGKASGFFGTYEFNLNTGTNQNRVGPNSRGASTEDLRLDEVLGPDSQEDSLLSFEINADADIHLFFESKRDSLIPSYQAELIVANRFGSGSSVLELNDNQLIGLGDADLGADVVANADDTDFGAASPEWRFDRSQLTADGGEGRNRYAFQNISLDLEGYLSGPIYDTLLFYDKTVGPIRPMMDFLTTAIPGTEWMAEPFVIGDLLGPQFATFLQVYNTLEKLFGDLSKYVGKSNGNGGRLRLGSTFVKGSGVTDEFSDALEASFYDDSEKRRNRYIQAQNADIETREFLSGFDDPFDVGGFDDGSTEKSRFRRFKEAFVDDKGQNPNEFSDKFNKLRNNKRPVDENAKGFKAKAKNSFNEQINDAMAENDARGGKRDISAGLSGGGFELPALGIQTATSIFMGEEADLLTIELPTLTVSFTYTKFFPLPAFPPLGVTLGLGFEIFVSLNMGWDTTGFYWVNADGSSPDEDPRVGFSDTQIGASSRFSDLIPPFGFKVRFSAGVELNLGLFKAGIEAFFEVGVNFFWNTPDGTDKLRQSEINWLWNRGDSLFDINFTGTLGVTFYVDLTIPIPFVGPITKRIISHTFSVVIFDETIDFDSGFIHLAEKQGDVLRLNMGRHADDRLFFDTQDRNEVFRVYNAGDSNSSDGEDIVVAYSQGDNTWYAKYTGIKHILGYAGRGQTEINAAHDPGTASKVVNLQGSSATVDLNSLDPVKYSTLHFFGGDGSSLLKAAGASTFGHSRLIGGNGSATLDARQVTGRAAANKLLLVTGDLNSIVEGSDDSDIIVSSAGSDILRGNGGGDLYQMGPAFGRDRIYATGTGNQVSFDSLTVTGFDAGPSTFNLGSQSDGVKFQFGPLVQSAKRGPNTAFFAVDPSGTDSIDTWTGTAGEDTFNVFHFAPNKTLNLVGKGGNNFYNVFLGNPEKIYDKNPTRNTGTITIDDTGNDSSDNKGFLNLTQTFAQTITYDSDSVDNQREQLTMSGIEQINLDAGDSTLIWGDASSPSTYQSIAGGTITTGRIIMVGNVTLSGTDDVELNLNRTFNISRKLNLEGSTAATKRSLTINVNNPNPQLVSDLYIGGDGGIFLSDGSGAGTGTGHGTITLNVGTGSILNTPAETGGTIKATNGVLEMTSLKSIGNQVNALQIEVGSVGAQTTDTTNTSGLQGIYLYSPRDLNVRATQNLGGISTVNGKIGLEVAAGHKLTYSLIDANGNETGAGRDVTLVADNIELAGDYSVFREVEKQETITEEVTTYEPVTGWFPITITYNDWFVGTQTFTYWIYTTIYQPVTNFVQKTITFTEEESVSFTGGTESLEASGNLYIKNKTDDWDIAVGDEAAGSAANTLYITQALLDSWSGNVEALKIGRTHDDSDDTFTGTVDIRNRAFSGAVEVYGSEITFGGTPRKADGTDADTDPGKVSSDKFLLFDAYDLASTGGTVEGTITLPDSLSMEAQSIFVYSATDLVVDGKYNLTAVTDGLMQFQAGHRSNAGSITLKGNFSGVDDTDTTSVTENVGSDLKVITGENSGSITVNSGAVFNLSDLVSLDANKGGISQDGSAYIVVDNLELLASAAITVNTRIKKLNNAEITGNGTMTINEYDSLNVVSASATAGNITIKTGYDAAATSGDLFVHQVDAGTNVVTFNATGQIANLSSEDLETGEVNVAGNKLDATAVTGINLKTRLAQVDLTTTATDPQTGSIQIDNTGSSDATFNVIKAMTNNGLISLTTTHDISLKEVRTNQNSHDSDANSITVLTKNPGGGDITVGEIDTEGHADVTLTADGKIEKASPGTSLLTIRDLFAVSNANLTAADTVIHLSGTLREATMEAKGKGQITLDSTGAFTARNIETFEGDISLTTTGTNSDLAVARIDANTKSVALDVSGKITDLEGTTRGATDSAKITADTKLTVDSTGDTTLDTSVGTLDAEVVGTGFLTVTESNNIDLETATTTDGKITIVAGVYDSVADNLISSGNAFIGTVSAGNGANDADITTYGGAIRNLSGATDPRLTAKALEAITFTGIGNSSVAINSTIESLIAEVIGIGTVNINNSGALTVDSLLSGKGVKNQGGNVTIHAGGSITHDVITATKENAQLEILTTSGDILAKNASSKLTTNGLILEAPGDIKVRTAVDDLTADIKGGSGPKELEVIEDDALHVLSAISTYADFDFQVGGDLNIRTMDASQSRDITIDVEGDISKTTPAGGTDPDFNVRSNKLTIDSLYGIDLITRVLNFDVESEALFTAPAPSVTVTVDTEPSTDPANTNTITSTDTGFDKITTTEIETVTDGTTKTTTTTVTVVPVVSNNFVINNLNATTITRLHTFDGSIDFTNEGNVTYDSIQGGNGASFDDTLTFDVNNGFFKRIAEDTSVIRANKLVADVSGTVDLETRLVTLDLQTDAAGNIDIDEFDGLTVDQLQSFNGAITLDADGNVLATLIQSDTSSAANKITINLNDATSKDANLTVTRIDAGLSGIVDLNIDGVIDNSDAATSLLRADRLEIDAHGSDSNVIDLRTRVNHLFIKTTGVGDVRINETDASASITLHSIDIANGNFHLTAAGDVIQDAKDKAGNAIANVVITRTATNDTFWNIGGALSLTSGKIVTDWLEIDAVNDVTIDTTVNTLDVDITGTAITDKLLVTETDNLTVENIKTANGDVTMTVGEAGVLGFAAITTAGNLLIKNLIAGSTNNRDINLTVYGTVKSTGDKSNPAIQGDKMTMDNNGEADITTDLTTLDAETFAAGSFKLVETDDLTIDDLKVFNGATTLDIGTSLVLINGEIGSGATGTLDLDTGTTADINTLKVSGNADLDIGTDLIGMVDGDFNGTLNLNVGVATGTDGSALITNIDVVGAAVVDVEEDLTMVTSHFHDTLTLDTGTSLDVTNLTVDGNADIEVGTSAIARTLADFNAALTQFVTGTILDINTINVTGNALINVGTDLTQIVNGDFDGTLTLNVGVATGTDGSALIKTIDVVGQTIFDIEEDLVVNTGDFHDTFTVDTGTSAQFDDVDVTGVADLEHGTSLLVTLGNFDSTLDVIAGTTVTFTTVNVKDDVDVDAGGKILFTTVDVDGGSVDLKSTGGDVEIVKLTADSANEQVLIDAHGNIFINTLTTDTATGRVELDAQTGKIERTAPVGSLTAIVGRILADELIAEAATGMTAFTDTNFLTVNISGPAGDIEVDELDTLTLRTINTPSGTFDLEVGDRIEVDPAVVLPTPHVNANTMILTSVNGIAKVTGFLNANSDIIDAFATASGGIYINNLKDVELRQVVAEDGEIQITNTGSILATDVRSNVDSEANDIQLTTAVGSGGNITLNYVGAGHAAGTPGDVPPLLADVIIDSDGNINGIQPSTFVCHILADQVKLTAETGIGDIEPPIMTARGLSANTTVGSMFLGAATSTPFTFRDSSTGDGDIGFFQNGTGLLIADNIWSGNGSVSLSSNGGGGLFANNIRSNNGNVNLTSKKGGDTTATNTRSINGSTNVTNTGGGDQTVDNLFSQNGNINLTVATGGELTVFNTESNGGSSNFTADTMEFLGGSESIQGTGNLTISAFSPERKVNIDTGFAGPVEQRGEFLRLTNRELEAIALSSFSNIFIGNPAGMDLSFQTFQVDDIRDFGLDFDEPSDEGTEPPRFDEPFGASTFVRLVDLLFPEGDQDASGGGGSEDDEFEEVLNFGLTNTSGDLNPFDQMDSGDGSGDVDGNEAGENQNGQEQEGEEGNSGTAENDDDDAPQPVADNPDKQVAVWTAGSLILFPMVKGVQLVSKAGRAARKVSAMLGLL